MIWPLRVCRVAKRRKWQLEKSRRAERTKRGSIMERWGQLLGAEKESESAKFVAAPTREAEEERNASDPLSPQKRLKSGQVSASLSPLFLPDEIISKSHYYRACRKGAPSSDTPANQGAPACIAITQIHPIRRATRNWPSARHRRHRFLDPTDTWGQQSVDEERGSELLLLLLRPRPAFSPCTRLLPNMPACVVTTTTFPCQERL